MFILALGLAQRCHGLAPWSLSWSKCEQRLKALPHFITEIDGLDIHFVHVRSKHEDALPLIVCHGWPGSVIEQMKIIEPLTNPTDASDAFHLVIPSFPNLIFFNKHDKGGHSAAWEQPEALTADLRAAFRSLR